jgi:spore maturation protein CgeB
MPKIFYIAMKYDYGDPKRGFGFEHYNFYDSLLRMNNGWNSIIYFPFDEIISKVGKDGMNSQLLEAVLKEKPDLCFFCLFGEEIKKETVKKITQSGIKTLNWFADDHWRFDNFSKYWAPLFSWIATTDSQAPKKYSKIGYDNAIKTQWACNHFLYKPLNAEKKYDVSFVGQPHGNRKKIIDNIRKAGININCWGRGWENGRISQEEMIKVFSQSRINLNLTKASVDSLIKSIARIFLKKEKESIKIESPRYWIDNLKSALAKQREQIKGRNFEIPGCGFLLTGEADNLQDYYVKGKEIAVYKNNADLIDKIRYYLNNKEEREEVAKAGLKRTLQEHTYEKRFNDIFKVIGLV